MAAKWQEDKVRDDLINAFCLVHGDPKLDFGISHIWALIGFARHVRKYCRSNAALKNFLNRIFPHINVVEVMKTDSRTGEQYKGLEVRER